VLQGLKLLLAPVAWGFLRASWHMPLLTDRLPAADEPLILCCLHRDILPVIMHVRPVRPVLLVSNSPDGDILIRTLGRRNYSFVRGATGEGGVRAFQDLVRQVESGRSVGLAVDGPKGPYGQVHDGVLQLARLTGRPILPIVARPGRHRVLGTWDRTVVPWPFSGIDFAYGPLLRLARQTGQEDIQRHRSLLQEFFAAGKATP
jgi:lysophospholipid acyltransferase (LPLAT)-like uncharacterized protein